MLELENDPLGQLIEKWSPVLDHAESGKITDYYRRSVTAQLLENQDVEGRKNRGQGYLAERFSLLGEAAPTNAMGASSSTAGAGSIDIFDPVLISLVRRAVPNLIAYDLCGVQPMKGPTGLVFALRPRYNSQTGAEAFYNEANTSFSAIGSTSANTSNFGGVLDGAAGTGQTGNDPTARASGSGYTVHSGMSTALAEALGDSATNAYPEMSFSIEKVSVTAKARALKAEYSTELAQDLMAVHGLSAEAELSKILSTEIIADINREIIRTINYTATAGAQDNTAAAGTFDLDVDANGRWMVERFKGLVFQLEREANAIAKATRKGRGNVMICTSDVASALKMAGMLDYTPALTNNLNVDDTGNTFAGVMTGGLKVYIDPYFASAAGSHYATMGYKGTSSAWDAGLFYCPYVPLQMVRAVGEDSFQPKIGFKTRYGIVANPFATSAADGVIAFSKKNLYYRLIAIKNIM